MGDPHSTKRPEADPVYANEQHRRARGSWPPDDAHPETPEPCRCGICERRRLFRDAKAAVLETHAELFAQLAGGGAEG